MLAFLIPTHPKSDGSLGNFRTLDDLSEIISSELEKGGNDGVGSEKREVGIQTVGGLMESQCCQEALKKICEYKGTI